MKAVFITPEKTDWGFEPVMWLRSQEMIRALEGLGVEVCPIDVKAFGQEWAADLAIVKKFRDHFVIAPNFNYFLQGAANTIELLDILEKPIVALWDDPLGALANFLNGQSRFAQSVIKIAKRIRLEILKDFAGSIADKMDNRVRRFRRVMGHPLLRHLSWDSGHIEAVDSLKLVERRKVTWFPIFTYSAFLKTGMRSNGTRYNWDVGFCGNLYLAMLRESRFAKDEPLRGLAAKIAAYKLQSLNTPVWNLMMREIAILPPEIRKQYGLYTNRMSFWNYYLYVVWYATNTWVRLGVLAKVNRDVALHGLFADPQTPGMLKEYPNLKYEGSAHNFDGLPQIYASTRINLCVSNTLIHQGMPSKLIECLASGGFALCDPKEDLVRFFGPVVENIFFRSTEELNHKIDYYLAHEKERHDIVNELGSKLRQHCTLEAFCRRVVDCVSQ